MSNRAYIAEGLKVSAMAVQARVDGMKSENNAAHIHGNSGPFDVEHFLEAEGELRSIAKEIKRLATNY